jgi:hypothetical protein
LMLYPETLWEKCRSICSRNRYGNCFKFIQLLVPAGRFLLGSKIQVAPPAHIWLRPAPRRREPEQQGGL